MPSRRARRVLGLGLAYLAGVQTAVVALDVVLRLTTPVTPAPHVRG